MEERNKLWKQSKEPETSSKWTWDELEGIQKA